VHRRVTCADKEANPTLSCNPCNVGEMGNLVVKVNMKEIVEEGPMMANTELLETWVSSGKANSISGKANQVTQVSWTCSSYPKLSGLDQGYSSLITSQVRLG
jgi:hypothetical protein